MIMRAGGSSPWRLPWKVRIAWLRGLFTIRSFIVNRIILQCVHGPANHRLLAFKRAYRGCIFLRQPGESRNLRCVHSIRYEIQVSFTNRKPLPEASAELDRTFASKARCGWKVPDRRHASVSRRRESGRRGVPHVGNPYFPILRVESDTGRMAQAGFFSFDNLRRCYVTLICPFEYENIAAHIVGDPQDCLHPYRA